jgi:hypothetical protein
VDRGKRLSRSNIIGEKGEVLFKGWALDHHLTANKVTTDIGIDFFCQVTEPVAGSESVEGQGPVLAAQVKTAEDGDDPRLVLDRIDATDLLRQTHATCLFGLCLSEGAVRFQFLDRAFIDRLIAFLDSEREKVSIRYKTMASESSLFLRLLKRYTQPFEQMQLRIHLIHQRVKNVIPGAELSVESTREGSLSKVVVPWIPSAFSIDPEAKEQVRLKFLREGIIDPEQAGVELHPVIVEALRATNSAGAVLAGVGAVVLKVKVRWEGASAVQPFDYREFGTEKNFVHRSGLRITMDRATVQMSDGHHHHAMQSEVFQPIHPASLVGSAINFFRLFRPGALIELQPGWETPLENFGDNLTTIGQAVDGLPGLCTALKQSLRRISLGDLRDEEFSRSTWFLEALLIKEIPIGMMAHGFVVGPAAELPLDQIPTIPVSARVPIALNWKDSGFAIWVDCDADAYLQDDRICGIRLKNHTGWRIQKTSRFDKSIYPELWFAKDWPAVPLREDLSGTTYWTYDGSEQHPFEAKIRLVRQND